MTRRAYRHFTAPTFFQRTGSLLTSNDIRDADRPNRLKLTVFHQKPLPHNTKTAMSLRAALTYAGNFLAQVPFLQDLPNPFHNPTFETGPLPPSYAPYTGEVTHYEPLSGAPSCPIDGPVSCQKGGPDEGSCCFVYPGGRILLTQFWDRDVHVGGSEEDWTLHGLW